MNSRDDDPDKETSDQPRISKAKLGTEKQIGKMIPAVRFSTYVRYAASGYLFLELVIPVTGYKKIKRKRFFVSVYHWKLSNYGRKPNRLIFRKPSGGIAVNIGRDSNEIRTNMNSCIQQAHIQYGMKWEDSFQSIHNATQIGLAFRYNKNLRVLYMFPDDRSDLFYVLVDSIKDFMPQEQRDMCDGLVVPAQTFRTMCNGSKSTYTHSNGIVYRFGHSYDGDLSIYYQTSSESRIYPLPTEVPLSTMKNLNQAARRIVTTEYNEYLVKIGVLDVTWARLPSCYRVRDPDQKKVMGCSAAEFLNSMSRDYYGGSWEWLHLFAFSFNQVLIDESSTQNASNLVAGSAHTNTDMLVIESFIKDLLLKEVFDSVEVTAFVSNPAPIESSDNYCACASQIIHYKICANSSVTNRRVCWTFDFAPFVSSGIPLAAAYFYAGLASLYAQVDEEDDVTYDDDDHEMTIL